MRGEGQGYRRPVKGRNSEQGFVLVTVLIIIAILLPVVIGFYARAQVNLIRAENFRDSTQTLRAARSGVEGAMGLLQGDDQAYDSSNDQWAMEFPSVNIGEGVLTVQIEDEDGRLNINKLVDQSGLNVDANTERRLMGLITRIGGKPEVVDALIDWIDANDDVRGSGGAESSYYANLGYQPKNGPVDSLDELLLIKGFDNDLLVEKGLKRFITAAPTDGKVNVSTAPPEVLLDLHEELREGLVEEIVRRREQTEFKNVEEVKSVIGMTEALYAKIFPLIKVNSSVFTVESTCNAGKVSRRVEAVLVREANVVQIYSWREF